MPHSIKKFIIFGQSRSGSTLLVNLLNSHPDIHCEGELLQYQWKYIPNKTVCNLVQYYPLPFFSWRKRICKTPAYGFKLFVYHMKFPHFVLSKLVKDNWRIIHIRRENHLRRALSNLIAKETNHWHSRPHCPDPSYRVRIPTEKLAKALKMKWKWDAMEADVLRLHPHFTLFYEKDLADSTRHQETIDHICNYIGLTSSPVQTSLRKTDPRPLSEILLNYDEILAFINNSEFHPLGDHEKSL